MVKKCLIIVPHPDDEINIAGAIFDQLKENEFEVTVVLCTNGDFYPSSADVRVKEALKAKAFLGYNDLVLLGYGDNYINMHIYDAPGNEIVTSKAGFSETYNTGGLITFHFLKYGCQTSYTRDHFKDDLRELLLDIDAEILICVDVDNHPDHRAISLLFDEAVGEVLKTKTYNPIILKKFAYLGVFFGKEDYFSRIMIETLPSYENHIDENYAYPYYWDERIRIKNNSNNYPLAFWKSNIFKALRCYRSQKIYLQYTRICNLDTVFWHRCTSSLSYKATVEASSGDPSYVNDFKIIDTDEIRSNNIIIKPSRTKAWIPNTNDVTPYVRFSFYNPVDISFVVIYQHPTSIINRVRILTDKGDNFVVQFKSSWKIEFKTPLLKEIKILYFIFIDRSYKEDIIIYEIEIYPCESYYHLKKNPLNVFVQQSQKTRNTIKIFMYLNLFKLYCNFRVVILRSLQLLRWRILYKLKCLIKF